MNELSHSVAVVENYAVLYCEVKFVEASVALVTLLQVLQVFGANDGQAYRAACMRARAMRQDSCRSHGDAHTLSHH